MHYRTPYQGGAIRSWHLSTQLNKQGIDCEVITAHSRSHYEVHPVNNVKIHYLPVKYSNYSGFFKRVWAFWKFNVLAWHLVKKLPKPDLFYVISTPLTIGKLALKINRKIKVPYVFEIGDIWPEAPIQMGALKNRFLIKYFQKLESEIYRQAKGIISMSPAISGYLEKRGFNENIIEIPNFSDIDFYGNDRNEIKFQFFEEKKFIIGSVGAIGKANHLDFIIDAARYMHQQNKPIGFVLMGDGSERIRLEKMAVELPNVKFLKFAHQKYVRDVLHSCNAVYLSYKDIPILETGSPNRLFDALAAGKLVITNFGGWVADLVSKNNCGFQTDPHNPEDLWEKLHPYLHDDEKLRNSGENSFKMAKQFNPKDQIKLLSEWLKQQSRHSGN